MLFTRSGTWIRTILWYDHATGLAEVVCRYDDFGEKTSVMHASKIRADGGLAEIADSAIERRNTPLR